MAHACSSRRKKNFIAWSACPLHLLDCCCGCSDEPAGTPSGVGPASPEVRKPYQCHYQMGFCLLPICCSYEHEDPTQWKTHLLQLQLLGLGSGIRVWPAGVGGTARAAGRS